MSFKALTWAAEQDVPDTKCFAVLMAMANYADDKGVCWPSQSMVAEKTKLARETVSRTIKTLCDLGFIKRQSKSYQLCIDNVIHDHMGSKCDVTEDHKTVTEDHIPDKEGVTDDHTCVTEDHMDVTEDHSHLNQSYNQSYNQSSAADAREENISENVRIGKQISKFTGWEDDPNWFGDYSRIEAWLAAGWDPYLDILPTVKRLMERKQGPPPKTLKYFEQAIADAHATRLSPTPEGNPKNELRNAGHRGSSKPKTNEDALNNVLGRLQAKYGEPDSPSGPAMLCDTGHLRQEAGAVGNPDGGHD